MLCSKIFEAVQILENIQTIQALSYPNIYFPYCMFPVNLHLHIP